MQKKIKSFTVLDDGYIVVQLTKKSDVDTYMASLIQKNKALLPCVQDQKAKSKFYYDRRKYASLTQILNTYHFCRKESLMFLYHLFQRIQEVEEEYPIVLELDSVYVQEDLQSIAILALPIHEHRNSENDMHTFLSELMLLLQAEDEVVVLGRLSLCLRDPMLSTSTILKELQKNTYHSILAILKWREYQQKRKELKVQNQLALEDLFISIQRNYEVYKAPIEVKPTTPIDENETVELFAIKKMSCYLKDKDDNKYELDTNKSIGRGEDCDILLSGQTVSSHHAGIHVEKDRIYIEDLNSSNGTSVNGEQLQEKQRYLLHHQDQIQFADVTMRFFKEGEL